MPRHKYQLYKHLAAAAPQIYEKVASEVESCGLGDLRHQVGLTGAVSGCHGLLTDKVRLAIDAGAQKVIPNSALNEQVREIVKDFYGDDWDAAVVSTCEGALWVTFDTLFSPPLSGRGDNYRGRYIAPYERHLHHQGAYGRPFPPRYKDLFSDRGVTSGEGGFYGKRLTNLETVIVPCAGADYPCHGIKYFAVPFMQHLDATGTLGRLRVAAERHSESLVGFTSLGYDTPGYGYGERTSDGHSVLQQGIGTIAAEFGVPYVVDNAWGLPFVGVSPKDIGADVMMYSMDKAAGAPTCGLIIGREESMVHVRRALGIHGERRGGTTSHGKGAYVMLDPGKEALLGVIAALETLRDDPKSVLAPMYDLARIVTEELQNVSSHYQAGGWSSHLSENSLAVELNYEDTWNRSGDGFGYPVFSIEDMYAGSHILQEAMHRMGVIPTIAYDANILISPGLGTTDASGELIEDRTRAMIRGLARIIDIVGDEAQNVGQ
jgi:hypothetical protein